MMVPRPNFGCRTAVPGDQRPEARPDERRRDPVPAEADSRRVPGFTAPPRLRKYFSTASGELRLPRQAVRGFSNRLGPAWNGFKDLRRYLGQKTRRNRVRIGSIGSAAVGAGNDQTVLGARHADVAEPPLLFEFGLLIY